jgi:hypothetical protein
MSYYKCDDCGEMFDRTDMVFDESGAIQMCDTDWADFQGRLAMERYADLRHDPRPAVTFDDDAYPHGGVKRADYVERLLNDADMREMFA